jgi:mono/diheme cytochrome c family protein
MRSVRNVIALAACLVAAPIPAADTATDSLRELSVPEATRLAAGRPDGLRFPALTTLPADVARELARYPGGLALDGLTTLTDDTAEALAAHAGPLSLDGLTTVSAQAATALARHAARLSLDGVAELSDEAAVALVKTAGVGIRRASGGLSLRGLRRLSPAVATALAARKGGVALEAVTDLPGESAGILIASNAPFDFPRISELSAEAAQAIIAFPRERPISLNGLTVLPDEAAPVASRLDLHLPRLRSLSPAFIAAMLKRPRHHVTNVNFDGLEELADETAAAMKAHDRFNLSLNGLTALSPAAARSIGTRNGFLYLNGFMSVSAEILAALAEHEAHPAARPLVFLDGLTTLGDDAAAILARWPKWSGRLPRLETVSEGVATALASSRNWDGSLPAVKAVSAPVAKQLATRPGNLSLDGLGELPDDVAAALAGHAGGTLSLDGLRTLSDGAAAALATHAGRLSLDGLAALSSAAARSLAARPGDWLTIDGVKSLTPEAARALAAAPGVVSLTGLDAIPEDVRAILRPATGLILPAALRRTTSGTAVATGDEKSVHRFLADHCGECHGEDAEDVQGSFTIDKPWPSMGDIGGRVAYASIAERLRAGDMPPPSETKGRPDPAEAVRVMSWILAQLDTPLPGPAVAHDVPEKPVDGNRLPHAILFGGPRGPSVPPPPRLWRLSPEAYFGWVGSFQGANLSQQPFGLIQDPGIKDYAALYSPDEGASGLLLANADLIVDHQLRPHVLVNVKEKPEAARQNPWPNEARIKTCSPEEQRRLEEGVRVAGAGAFAPLMHPDVAATRVELEAAIVQQYNTALARPPLPAEVQNLVTLYDAVARDGDQRLAGRTILMAPLMAPEAVIRFETGAGAEVRPGVRMLSPREIVQAVSLAVGTKLDPELVKAAAAGGLKTRADVAAHVHRILDAPSIAKPRIPQFFREYFGYHRATEVFKDPLPEYRVRRGQHFSAGSMVEAADARVSAALNADRRVLERLLLGTEAGEPAQDGASPGRRRSGLLESPAWLVAWSTNFHTDPVRRGRWIREQLLGGRVPDLPINAAAMIPDDPHRTLRERQSVTRDAACWKCHYRMDDLGLPFEDHDHYGHAQDGEEVLDPEATARAKGRKMYRTVPLDTTGLVSYSGDPLLDGPVRDARELVRRLAGSERVRQVFIRHAFRFFMGRNETPGDAPALQEADRAYVENDGSFRAVVVSLLSSEAFLQRSNVPAAARPEKKTVRR